MTSSMLSTHVRYLIQNSDDADAASVVRELCEYVDSGLETSIVVLQVCLGYLTLHSTEGNKLQHEKVASTFKHFMGKPNFSAVLSHSLRNLEIKEDFLDNLANALCLSDSESFRLGLALYDLGTPDARTCCRSFCMAQIEKICSNPAVVSAELIRDIFMFLQQFDDLSRHTELFAQYVSSTQSAEALQFVSTSIPKEELCAGNLNRVMNLLHDSGEDEFDAILADMEKEMNVGDIIEELGYGVAVSAIQCKELLSQFLPLTEATISRILGTIARTRVGLEDNQNAFSPFCSALGCGTLSDLPAPSSWNVNNLVAKILELAPDTNWIRVIENLDHDGFRIPDMDAFLFFMSVYRIACQSPFPLHAVCGSVWKNSDGQLSFLQHAISAPSEVFTFAHSARKLNYSAGLQINEHQLGLANHAWLSLDVLDVLCQLAERGHASSVRLLLEHPLKHCPQVLLAGLAQINTAYNLIQDEVAAFLFPVALKSSVDSGLMLYLWHVNPHLVVRGFLDFWNMEPFNITGIVELCEELQILSSVIDSFPFSFGIRLAVIASQRGFLDLENWLSNCVNTCKDLCFEGCYKFVKEILLEESKDFPADGFRSSVSIFQNYLDATPVLVKFLKAHIDVVLSPQVLEEVESLYVAYMRRNSKSQNGGAKDSTTSAGYGDDVEAEANSYFHQMFSGQLGIDAMVQMLERFKESPVGSREVSIFDCMIANLFEEYSFFPKYPERQLKLAAILFGSVIKHQLVTHLTLGIALRGVLDALRKPADSKMFVFGTKALEQFVNRIIEWPQYCNHILQISHLRSSHPELVVVIEHALSKISSGHSDSDRANNAIPLISGSSQSFTGNGDSASSIQLQQRNEASGDDRNKTSPGMSNDARPLLSSLVAPAVDSSVRQKNAVSGSSTLPTSAGVVRPRGATSTRFGSALNIETLVAAADRREKPIEAPALEVQDKISFIINNISSANFELKAKELTEILTEQYYSWFAQYMVMKRASIEPNFHDLYFKFLDKVNSKALFKEIVQATYENCKVLLGSELIKSSSEERSLLKNLGSWLGKLTIGRNQVLRAREVDPKSLIVEAYEKGLMIAVIPFTSKILEPCQQSVAYQPPNPWTMGILGLLAEIYSMPNLKMNLKFDIEVLFKNLGVDMKDVLPTSLLKDRKRETHGNPDFSNKDTGVTQVSQPQMIPEIKPGTISSLSNVELPIEVANSPDSNHSKLLSQYAAPLRISSNVVLDDENLAALSVSDQLPSAQGLFQSAPTQPAPTISQFSAGVPNIGNHVIINQKLSTLNMHLPFQRVVSLVMERAIKEIVSSIVERSVRIACQTTLELVLKDYATEPDETRIYNAAHLMVASLAGSLAHVTCKEPLRGSISNHLRISLQGLNTGSDVLEQVVQLVTNDNLDLGCAAIEQAATEEAIRTIDAEISRQLSSRPKHRDGAASSFYDPNMASQNSIGLVPEFLRPKPGHLSISQQRIYEDFVQLPWQKPSSQTPPPLSAGSDSSSDASLSGAYGSSVSEKPGISYMSGAGNAGVDMISRPLDVAAGEAESSSVSVLSSTTHVVATGDTVNVQLPKPASSAEVHSLELSDSSKELGGSSQALVSSATLERLGNSITNPSLTTRDALDKYQLIAQKLEDLVTAKAGDADIQAVVSEVREVILRCVSRDEAALAVAQKAFKALYENASNSLHVGANLAILVAVRDVCKRVVKELTSWVIYSDDERKFNNYITLGLIQSELLNLAEYSFHMAKLLDGGRNKGATEFSISLLQCLVADEIEVISELHSLVDALAKLAAKPGSPELLEQLIESIRNPAFSSTCLSSVDAGSENDTRQSKDEKDAVHAIANREEIGRPKPVEPNPSGFRDQVSMLFAEWYKICNLPVVNDAACSRYVLQLHQSGLLKGDDITERLFHYLMELSVTHCLSSEVINSGTLQAPQQVMSFLAIDIYAKLVLSVLKYIPLEQEFSKISLLSKIMTVTVRFIHNDAEEKKTSFNPRPYFRLFINWILDLCSLDAAATDGANFQILTAFANTFHNLQPLKVPSFSFAWLELVSHRSFMPKLLTGNGQKGWPYVQLLLVDLLKFLEPFLRNADLGEPVNHLYKGTLRVLLVLLHDFPEFICDYHFTFCDLIPPTCVQMRNIILSSFPRNMRLPDPSTPNLKIDLLPEIHKPPRILSEVDAVLKANQMKNDVDEYLTMRQQNSTFLSELKQKLLLPTNEAAFAGTRYNVPLINSLVLYVGIQAIQQLQAGASQSQSTANIGALQMFKTLSSDLDAEGRYLFLNAIANQLRYPNSHTHYFSFFMLYLFSESDQEIIQEQITRVLLERLIVNRPQPWGLHITFIELIKNQRYNFWKQNFIRCAPEIEKLFDSVARSCGGLKRMDEGIVSNWVSDNSAH